MKSCIRMFCIIVVYFFPCNASADFFDPFSEGAVGVGYVKNGIQFEWVLQNQSNFCIYTAFASDKLWNDDSPNKEGDVLSDNHDKSTEDTGLGFLSFDIGVGFVLSSQVRFLGEVTYAIEETYDLSYYNQFNNYSYHKQKNSEFGFGGTISYIFSDKIEVYSGYNSFKKLGIGIRVLY